MKLDEMYKPIVAGDVASSNHDLLDSGYIFAPYIPIYTQSFITHSPPFSQKELEVFAKIVIEAKHES